jgi:hypothetical protein
MGRLLDTETGRQRMLWVLVITLSLSRYQFVWPTFSQSTEAVCGASITHFVAYLREKWKYASHT